MAKAQNLIGSAQACEVLGVDKSTLSRLVKAGTLKWVIKLPGKNGAMLFDPTDVNRVCLDRAGVPAK